MKKSQDFAPSVYECASALDTFMRAFENYSTDNSRELALRCSLYDVWAAGRRYQAQLEAEEQKAQRKLNAHKNNTKDIVEVAV